MSSLRLTKRESRQRSSELRALLCEWDPIGVMGAPDWPRDEYDCLIGPLLTLLEGGVEEREVGEFLHKEIAEHFGLAPENYDFPSIANRIWSWFDFSWRRLADLETICVALLGEGTRVWRPVQARLLDQGLFRIVGVDGDVRGETWEFSVGAVVRCEKREFESGEAAFVALECVTAAG